ncbi:hypothetical protein VNO78_18049 [Psophocarpus tetragonolobus]|uniref:Uncharacterized protein n=1 Tax=Psophocarpus tetragonolobus TaxID=3891 RepID=A0AAN9SP82_PSOTE
MEGPRSCLWVVSVAHPWTMLNLEAWVPSGFHRHGEKQPDVCFSSSNFLHSNNDEECLPSVLDANPFVKPQPRGGEESNFSRNVESFAKHWGGRKSS